MGGERKSAKNIVIKALSQYKKSDGDGGCGSQTGEHIPLPCFRTKIDFPGFPGGVRGRQR